jgi:tRNA threonylcarbamoyladenosine biosynthesis protein TsaB
LNILIIDTATNIEIVSLMSGGAVSDMTAPVIKSHSVTLFDNIDRACRELKISIGGINLIGVGTGPGSFTGIRIAVSTARMLAQILNVPLVGIKTHLIFAASMKPGIGDNVLVAFDAKKGRVFGALYRYDGGILPCEIVAPGDYEIERLALSADGGKFTHLIGDGAARYIGRVSGCIADYRLYGDFLPCGNTTCLLAEEIYKGSPGAFSDYRKIIPFYGRKSDAEVNLKNGKGVVSGGG